MNFFLKRKIEVANPLAYQNGQKPPPSERIAFFQETYKNQTVADALETLRDGRRHMITLSRLAAPIPPLAVSIAAISLILAIIDLDYQHFKLQTVISELKGIMAELHRLNLYFLEFHEVFFGILKGSPIEDTDVMRRITKLMKTPLRAMFQRELDTFTAQLLYLMRSSELDRLAKISVTTPEQTELEHRLTKSKTVSELAMVEIDRRKKRGIFSIVYDKSIYLGTLFDTTYVHEQLEDITNSAANLSSILESRHQILVSYLQFTVPNVYNQTMAKLFDKKDGYIDEFLKGSDLDSPESGQPTRPSSESASQVQGLPQPVPSQPAPSQPVPSQPAPSQPVSQDPIATNPLAAQASQRRSIQFGGTRKRYRRNRNF